MLFEAAKKEQCLKHLNLSWINFHARVTLVLATVLALAEIAHLRVHYVSTISSPPEGSFGDPPTEERVLAKEHSLSAASSLNSL